MQHFVPARVPATAAQLRRLGALVRGERQRRGWTMKDLRARSGVNEGTISQVERGRPAPLTGAAPTDDTLYALAHALNIPISVMFTTLQESHEENDGAAPSAFEMLFGSASGE